MTTTHSSQYLSCAETAKLIGPALKAAFPGVKFSVRSHTYAGGASIDIDWTDGPTQKTVDRLADDLIPDAEHGLREVHFGADFVFCHRSSSPELIARVVPLAREIGGQHSDPWCGANCRNQLVGLAWFVPSTTGSYNIHRLGCSPEHAAVVNAYRFDSDMIEED